MIFPLDKFAGLWTRKPNRLQTPTGALNTVAGLFRCFSNRSTTLASPGITSALISSAGRRVSVHEVFILLMGEPSLELPGGTKEDRESPEPGLLRECPEKTVVAISDSGQILTYYSRLDNVNVEYQIFGSDNVKQERLFARIPRGCSASSGLYPNLAQRWSSTAGSSTP